MDKQKLSIFGGYAVINHHVHPLAKLPKLNRKIFPSENHLRYLRLMQNHCVSCAIMSLRMVSNTEQDMNTKPLTGVGVGTTITRHMDVW